MNILNILLLNPWKLWIPNVFVSGSNTYPLLRCRCIQSHGTKQRKYTLRYPEFFRDMLHKVFIDGKYTIYTETVFMIDFLDGHVAP